MILYRHMHDGLVQYRTKRKTCQIGWRDYLAFCTLRQQNTVDGREWTNSSALGDLSALPSVLRIVSKDRRWCSCPGRSLPKDWRGEPRNRDDRLPRWVLKVTHFSTDLNDTDRDGCTSSAMRLRTQEKEWKKRNE